jgi:hypothetical protein
MPIGAPRPGMLARFIQWVKTAFQGAKTFVAAPIAAGDLPSLFAPRLAAVRAAWAPVSLASATDFATNLRTFALAARLRSVATQNVRCSLKGPRRRAGWGGGKPLPKPVPRVLKRYSPSRAQIAPSRKCGAGWSLHSADLLALPDGAVRVSGAVQGERHAA